METLFTSMCLMTFLLSLAISSLCALLVWIAIPDIAKYRITVFMIILIMSIVMTFQYANTDYNPDKRYMSLVEKYYGYKNESSSRK